MSLQIDVGRLLRRPGQRREIAGRHTISELRLSGAEVPGGVVELELELEAAAGHEVVLTGTISATWETECRRCLGPVSLPADVEVREVFVREAVEGETYPLDADDIVDVEAVVREALLLVLPVAPLCSGSCPGPVPERFPTGESIDTDQDRSPDPRWAALDQLSFE